MTPDSIPVAPGNIIAQKYRVESILGAGGMGYVVAARHLQLNERVAIKFLLPEMDANPEIHGRFLREARAAVRVKSEHVVRVTDVGELPTGAPYMVMEHLEGHSLSERLEANGPLPVSEAADYLLQACEAIAEAHSLGIIHRDLKPSNLFLTHRADGSTCVKVLDFGISKDTSTGRLVDGLTSTQQILGSPQFMSPEQLSSSRSVDARTDIWAVGITLYQLVTGVLPFDAESIPGLCLAIVQDRPAPLAQHRPGVPSELDAVVQRCLAKERSDRFGSVAELAQALLPFAPAHAHVSADRIARMSGVLTPTTERATVNERPRSPRWFAAPKLAVAAGALGVIAALLWLVLRRPTDSSQTLQPEPNAPAAVNTPPTRTEASPQNAIDIEGDEPQGHPAIEAKPTKPRRPAMAPAKRNPLDIGIK